MEKLTDDKYISYFDEALRRPAYEYKTEKALGALKGHLHRLMELTWRVSKGKRHAGLAYKWLHKTTGKYHVADLDRNELENAIKEIKRL